MKVKRALSLALVMTLCLGALSVPAAASELEWNGKSYYIPPDVYNFVDFHLAFEEELAYEELSEAEFQTRLDALVEEMIDRLIARGPLNQGDDFAQAEYEFDKSTGTITKVTVTDGYILDMPERIDRVLVETVAPGAIDDLETVGCIILPDTLEKVEGVIIRNCPRLIEIVPPMDAVIMEKIYENCPLMEGENGSSFAPQYVEADVASWKEKDGTMGRKNLPESLLTQLGIFRGNGSGMNWEGTLTRAEAATLLLRLQGAEEEAQAMAGAPSPFIDVPAWANGYVNLAYARGMVKGVGGGRFDPAGLCGLQEFSLMLLRLTDLTEGADYSWDTAVQDLRGLIRQGRVLAGYINPDSMDNLLYAELINGAPFTRQYACALIYRALSIPAGGAGDPSLGDKLVRAGAFPTTPLLRHQVRLTLAGAMEEPGVLELYCGDPAVPNRLTLRDGTVSITGPGNPSLSLAPLEGGYSESTGKASLTVTEPAILRVHTDWGGLTFTIQEDSAGRLYLDTDNGRGDMESTLYVRDELTKDLVYAQEPPVHSQTVASLARELTAGLTDDYDKAKAISQWIQKNIEYDYESYAEITGKPLEVVEQMAGHDLVGGLGVADQDPDSVLSRRLAVCGGYAKLTKALFNAVGIPVIYVHSGIIDHAWNEARINGRTIFIDNTWGEFDTPRDYFVAEHTMGTNGNPDFLFYR